MGRLLARRTFVEQAALILAITALGHCVIPEDLKPARVYTANDTSNYGVFVGSGENGESPKLQFVQGMTKVDGDYVIHARDNVFFVNPGADPNDAGEIQHKQVISWPSNNATIDLCRRKGKSKLKCHNYVKIFVRLNPPNTNRAIICGTNSFYAKCKHLQQTDDKVWKVSENPDFDGKPFCPFEPEYSVASTAADSNMYTATSTGFSGHDSMIHRAPVSVARGNDTNLRTNKGDAVWLNNPRFIRFADQPTKMYTFFTENEIEDKTYQVYSRVAQTCKSDQGGVKVMRNHFTSFFKATLNCSIPGHPPFYFNEMSDVTDVVTLTMLDGRSQARVVFAVMNTPRNSVPASAVCVFVVDDIEAAFKGPFLEKNEQNGHEYWGEQKVFPTPHPTLCGYGSVAASDSKLDFVRKHPLMSKSVNAWDMKQQKVDVGHHESSPVFTWMNAGHFLTTIDADPMPNRRKTVIYAGTEKGKLLKIVGDTRSGNFDLLDERTVFNEKKCGDTDRSVRKVTIDKDSGTVLLQFVNCVVFAPLCPLVTKCRKTCENSGDPHCVWRNSRCVSVTTSNEGVSAGSPTDVGQCNECVGGVCLSVGGQPRVAPDPSVPEQETNNTEVKNGTLDSKPEPTYSSGNNVTALAQAGDWTIPGGIGLVVGFFLALAFVMLALIALRCKREKSGKYPPKEKKVKKKKLQNGSVRKSSSRDSRRDSNHSNGHSKGRNASASSANRHVDNRNSVHEEGRRKRNITESSVGNRSEEDTVFLSTGDPLATPDSPNGRDMVPKHHLSTTSSQGGKRRMRNSVPSTSSAPDHAEDHQLSPSKRSIDDMGLMFSAQSRIPESDDQPASTPTDSDMLLPSGHQQRVPPVRTMSFQGGAKQFNRTYSMDNARATTIGHGRPNMRSIGRQHSLQVVRTTHQPVYAPHPMVAMSPHGAQPHGPVPTWTQAAPSVPQQSGRYDKRMTHSLDRRQLLKGQNYQLVPNEVFNEEPQPMGPPQKSFQSQRKRNVSESAAGAIPPSHVQMQRNYLAVVDEQEPMSNVERPTPGPPKALRDNLKLNLQPMVPNGNQLPRGEFPGAGNGYSAFARPPFDGVMSPMNRNHLRLNVPRSNPGTPQHENPPTFGEPPYSPSYVNKGNTTFPSAQKNKRLPAQRSLPNEGLQRLSGPFGSGTPEGHSPSKSNPTSPQVGDNREPVYPGQERERHASGNKQPTPSSPVKSYPPVTFANLPPNTNGNGMPRARHASGPETGRLVNPNQRTDAVKRPQKAISVPDAPKEFA